MIGFIRLGGFIRQHSWRRIFALGMLLGLAQTIAMGQYAPKSRLNGEDPLFQMLPVPAGSFVMGRADDGDDGLYGYSHELPRHTVILHAYEIGKYPITNEQFCEVLNWALERGYLENSDGSPYTSGSVYTRDTRILGLVPTTDDPFISFFEVAMIDFAHDSFVPVWRPIPHSEFTYMGDHPAVSVSWYGCLAFSNWLSEMESLTPCYDLDTWELIDADPLTTGQQFHSGYRLPTEAEWVRAAGWDGTKNWTYGIQRDSLLYPEDAGRANFSQILTTFSAISVNPVALLEAPHTSPVGWFNGINVSPNGGIQTIDSKSPVGAYDMVGNVREWVYDWTSFTYYGESPLVNPTGPTTGTHKVMHGGSFNTNKEYTRVNNRDADLPGDCYFHSGFRLARSPNLAAAANWNRYE